MCSLPSIGNFQSLAKHVSELGTSEHSIVEPLFSLVLNSHQVENIHFEMATSS
jgi:hypothetical protein